MFCKPQPRVDAVNLTVTRVLRSGVAAALFLSALTVATPSFCEVPSPDPDPWFGRDKALHFAGSFALATGGYALGTTTTDSRYGGLAVGGGIALGLGAAKEGLDAAGLGTPSWRDFAWDCVGTAFGLAVSFTFDVALRGASLHANLAPGR